MICPDARLQIAISSELTFTHSHPNRFNNGKKIATEALRHRDRGFGYGPRRFFSRTPIRRYRAINVARAVDGAEGRPL
jgi:hypothetical protein